MAETDGFIMFPVAEGMSSQHWMNNWSKQKCFSLLETT